MSHIATDEKAKTPLLSNRSYDAIKWVAQYFLPAVGTLYFALALLWDLPEPEKVIGTITAIDIFLGALLGFSKKSYVASDAPYDGQLVVENGEVRDIYRLEVDVPLEEVRDKDSITLKIQTPSQ